MEEFSFFARRVPGVPGESIAYTAQSLRLLPEWDRLSPGLPAEGEVTDLGLECRLERGHADGGGDGGRECAEPFSIDPTLGSRWRKDVCRTLVFLSKTLFWLVGMSHATSCLIETDFE
jgi:hypothetical protein